MTPDDQRIDPHKIAQPPVHDEQVLVVHGGAAQPVDPLSPQSPAPTQPGVPTAEDSGTLEVPHTPASTESREVLDPAMFPFGKPEPLRETGIFAKPVPPTQAELAAEQQAIESQPQTPIVPIPMPPNPPQQPVEPVNIVSGVSATAAANPAPAMIPFRPPLNPIPEKTLFTSGPMGESSHDKAIVLETPEQQELEASDKKRTLALVLAMIVFVPFVPLVGLVMALQYSRRHTAAKSTTVTIAIAAIATLLQLSAFSVLGVTIHKHSIQDSWKASHGTHLQQLVETTNNDITSVDQALANQNSTLLLSSCSLLLDDSRNLQGIPMYPTAAGQQTLSTFETLLGSGAQSCIKGIDDSSNDELSACISSLTEAVAYEPVIQTYE